MINGLNLMIRLCVISLSPHCKASALEVIHSLPLPLLQHLQMMDFTAMETARLIAIWIRRDVHTCLFMKESERRT